MSETTAVPTDAFRDEMTYVESYDGYLPKSKNIPTETVRHGVSGISHDGDMYCLDCAIDMGIVAIDDGEVVALVDGEITPTEEAPRTGVVLPSYESDTQMHCGQHKECINAVSGRNHPYNHSLDIGVGIEETILQH
jgi:hypothetical protein